MSIRHLSALLFGVVVALMLSAQPAAAQHWGCGYGGYAAYPGYGYVAPAPVSVAVYSAPVVAYRPAYVVPVRAYTVAPVAAYAPLVPVVPAYRTAFVTPIGYSRYPAYGGYLGVGHYHHRLRRIDEIKIEANRYGGYDIDIDYD